MWFEYNLEPGFVGIIVGDLLKRYVFTILVGVVLIHFFHIIMHIQMAGQLLDISLKSRFEKRSVSL